MLTRSKEFQEWYCKYLYFDDNLVVKKIDISLKKQWLELNV